MSNQPEAASEGAPEWMVSYADMITIMMAFFVVLYASTASSGSHDKGGKSGEEAKGGKEATHGSEKGPGPISEATEARLQRVFDSLYARFGPQYTLSNCWVGGPPSLRTPSRGKKLGGGQGEKTPSPPGRPGTGESSTVLVLPKSNDNVVAGGRIFFNPDAAALDDQQRKQLHTVAESIAGKLQKIEIRGHTSRGPLPRDGPYHNHFDLAYARCQAVNDCLVGEGIDPRRIRLSLAGDNEPVEVLGDPLNIKQNSRVEVRLLNEWVREPIGSDDPGTPAAMVSAGK